MTTGHRDCRAFLERLRAARRSGRIHVTEAAAAQAEQELGWDEVSIFCELDELEPEDLHRTARSTVSSADLVWVFCPWSDGEELLIRLVERNGIVVVSFHRRET